MHHLVCEAMQAGPGCARPEDKRLVCSHGTECKESCSYSELVCVVKAALDLRRGPIIANARSPRFKLGFIKQASFYF
jgi:hypothetical protein